MKKISIAFLSFVLMFAAHTASASTLWNGASNDCQSIAIANQSTSVGYGSTSCWNASSVQANAGETISVRIYYHNSSDLFGSAQTATNVRIVMSAPTTPSSNPSFTGQIVSDQGSVSFGQVSATLLPGNVAQTLTLSSIRWYPNQSQTPQAFLYGQSGNELFNKGLEIGSIAPGYNTQGSVVVNYVVSTPSIPSTGCTILNYNASPTTISSGSSSTLSWNTVGCATVSISGIGQVSSPSGSVTVTPTSNTTYSLRAYGSLGNNPTVTTRDVTVNIGALLASICFDRGAINFGGFSPCRYPIIIPTCPDRGALNFGGSLPCQYPITIQTCNDHGAVNYGGALPCQYPTLQNCVINNFSTSATVVNPGQSILLTWGTSNCTTVSVAGNNMSNYSLNGSQMLYPTSSGTYVITASGPNNQAPSQSVYVTVSNNYAYPSYDSYNSYNTYNGYGCLINSFTASPNYVSFGSGVTLSWSTNNCTSVSVSGSGISNTSLNGSQTIYPSNSGTYTITAYSPNTGNVIRTVYVTITGTSNNQVAQQPYVVNSCAVTTVATNLTKTSAQLNGTLSGSGYAATNTYFEYGTTVDLGMRTENKLAYGNDSFNTTISGLDPDTIYYYRAVADCANGTSRGAIEILNTLGQTVTRPTLVQGTTVATTQSPVKLSITNKYQQIGVGDLVDYTVIYKNIGKTTLAHPLLQVVVPKGITLVNASAGIYEAGSNTQNIQLQDIAPKEEGAVYLQGRVNALNQGSLQVATTAILIYTSATGAQENVMAYVLNQSRMMFVPAGAVDVNTNNNLGAAAFFGAFFNLGLIGWLIVILILLTIIYLLRKHYYKPTVHSVPLPPYGHH